MTASRNIRAASPWPERHPEFLALCSDPALSYGEIARRMGLSKGSIIGHAHRSGLPARQAPVVPPKPKPVPRVRRVTLPAPQRIEAPTPLHIAGGYAMTSPAVRADRYCQWPMWAHGERPGLSPRYCDGPVEAGSYCAGHRAIAYRAIVVEMAA